ncbi:MAG: hypothetical protein ACLVJH_01710 [Faecalibacterium prausnitzii]
MQAFLTVSWWTLETVLTTIPLTKCRPEEAVELYAASGLGGYGHADDEVTFSSRCRRALRPPSRRCCAWYGHRLPRRLRDGNGGPS